MAEFPLKPDADGYLIDYDGPDTLAQVFDDKTQRLRTRTSISKRIFTARFTLSEADAKILLDFFDLKMLTSTFTMVTYDAQAVDPDIDEATVRFVAKPPQTRVGPRLTGYTVSFREV